MAVIEPQPLVTRCALYCCATAAALVQFCWLESNGPKIMRRFFCFSPEHGSVRGERVLHLPGVVAAVQPHPVLHLRGGVHHGLQRHGLSRS